MRRRAFLTGVSAGLFSCRFSPDDAKAAGQDLSRATTGKSEQTERPVSLAKGEKLDDGEKIDKVATVDPKALSTPTADELASYTWLDSSTQIRRLETSIAPPNGFKRVATSGPGAFDTWLRGLPLRAAGTPVNSYTGALLHEANDSRIAAVAEIDCGNSDLQQCADSAIRMHAEWLWSRGDKKKIGYHFVSGDLATYSRYAAGERPSIDGKKVVWKSSATPSDSRATFRKYLDMVFMYASTISLERESKAIEQASLTAGDFFIMGGSPGHTVLVLDVAESSSGDRVALLGQGFMPAQDFQVLSSGAKSGPWFSLSGSEVDTPFWDPFPWSSLHRFPKVPK